MKQNCFSVKTIVLSFLLVAGMCITVFAEDSILRLGYSDSEAFPYQIQDDANPPGIAFEIISEAARMTGIK